VVERPARTDADFRYRIYNADGGEVEQCGNGARCFVKFVRDHGLTTRDSIRVETAGGLIEPVLNADGGVTVNMGVPRFAPADVPFASDRADLVQTIDVAGVPVDVTALSMGNPHAVQVVADVDAAPVATQGPAIERHPRFPQRANAGYMQVVDRATIRLRVHERGSGETLACGSGACAAAVTAIARGLAGSPLRVEMRGGALSIAWAGPGAPVFMTGPAVTVYEGEWEPPAPAGP
jgi:diaminopimelate epimerase